VKIKIHKEGRNILIFLVFLLVLLNLIYNHFFPGNTLPSRVLIIGSSLFFLLVLQFFRNPKVITLEDENQILAPADGKIVAIEEVMENEYLNQSCTQISIFMSPLNVHINRSPVSGTVKYFKYHSGNYMVAWHPKSSSKNEHTTMVVQVDDGPEILVRQIAGAMARRIKWYIEVGQEVTQGHEFGFIKFGSRVDVLIPTDAKIKINLGQKTRAGKTVLAEFI